MGIVDGNSMRRSTGNARNQKHCNRNEECLHRLDTFEERIHELADRSTETKLKGRKKK